MPFKSKAQRKWMYATHPKIAKRWEKHTKKDKLPKKLKENDRWGKEVDSERYVSILMSNMDKLARNGIHIKHLKPIGTGTRAIVFDMDGRKVFKMTSDRSDAEAMILAKGKHLKHVAYAFKIFAFPKPNDDIFGMVMEKLLPTNERDLEEAIRDSMLWNVYEKGDWNNTLFQMKALIDRRISRTDDEKRKETLKIKYDKALEKLKQYNIPEIVNELNSAEIDFVDYSEDNIMKRSNGDHVLVDLGRSDMKDRKNIASLI